MYDEGGPVPPVFVVVPIFELVHRAVRESVPRDVMAAARAAVHGEHDIVFHRPARIGSRVRSRAELSGVQTSASGTRVTVRLLTSDADDRLIVEQFWTTFLQGSPVAASWGDPPPDHSFPPEARSHPVGDVITRIDEDMPLRYADASGDHSPHHVDREAARREGFPDLLVHGLSVMALSGQAVLTTVARGRPGPPPAAGRPVRLAGVPRHRSVRARLRRRHHGRGPARVRLRGRRRRMPW